MSFKKILNKYREISFSKHDKGNRFERLIQAWLRTDPKYAFRFKNVWLWNEFPGKMDLGGSDTGIDLVALTNECDYWAIQCKCYQESSTIDKPAVDSFLATSGREFRNENMQTVRFAHRLWISTTNKWGSNAEEAIKNQNPPVTRLNLFELIESPVDWNKLEAGVHGEAARTPRKSLRPHQKQALENTHEYFKSNDRGKLIMACGTGKTFNALRIAEHETEGKGLILFLVPSIALLGQSLREWSADANEPINAICICSDPEITRQRKRKDDTDAFSVVDLALPASTNTDYILHQFEQIKARNLPGLTVVFSTYQSIEVLARAQKAWMEKGFPEFDLVICDEAHRTTGVSLAGEDESAFIRVHDAGFIKSKKRLYMTATPRLYSDDTKSKAAQAEAILCSMDDPALYGEEIYRIGFGEAVERDLLTDYKVLILTLNDKDVPPAVQRMIADKESEISTDDVSKLIGCINALSKKFLGDDGKTKESDPEPMRRAVAFCASIATSKKISATYNTATEAYLGSLPPEKKEQMVSVASRHMDGTMAAPERDQMLTWLKEETVDNECRIITNVRVLSEGVDVPSLDAVLFLSARNSQVDVVQSVGRVMRRSPGKNYGYIIIPVVVPADVEADKALDDNERYRVVWTVLNALRAHDDRFNAIVNKIELNRSRPLQILVGRPEYSFDENGNPTQVNEDATDYATQKDIGRQLALQFEQLQSVVFARMVQKVGDRRYWEQWAKDVAVIADRQIERIRYLISGRKDEREAFDNFLAGLQKNINPAITESQAVEMLAQHIITKPIFEALFEGYSFVKNNAVSTAMQNMLDVLQGETIAEESETLQRFYDSVKKRAAGIDNAEGKQRIIIELYDKFFKTAFPKMVEQLGIVYTPVEVVDFIIHSVNDVLKKEFGRSISDENIHILDPFTGTGTFITRLIQSGLIEEKDLERKYKEELHANEIVLLAYYIAAVNIENAYHDAHSPLEGGRGVSLSTGSVLSQNPTPHRNKIIPYSSSLKEKARELRKNSTLSEVLFWKEIQNKKLRFQFHRQVPLDEYIVDFYCHELMLAIEIDGSSHDSEEAIAHDQYRQKKLESFGVRFLRFDDLEVKKDMANVLRTLEKWLEEHREDLAGVKTSMPHSMDSLPGEGNTPLLHSWDALPAERNTPLPPLRGEYSPFEGIVLTDTFQLGETDESQKLFSEMFPQNSARVVRQKKAPLRVIMGNPPYSVGQKSANDNAQNQKYEKLDARISSTYAKATAATNKNSLYDSYIKAFRWSTDRLDPIHGGVIAFVSNGAWLDGNSADGFRKILEKEFTCIWVLNLRGNQRTSGELSRKEGGKIFGSGSRTPIAITLLVKNPDVKNEKAIIRYYDIGDYLNREEKLSIIKKFATAASKEMPWRTLNPNEHGDWISQRNDVFGSFIPIGEKGENIKTTYFNQFYSRGLATARDAYCYNSSLAKLKETIHVFINFYEEQRRQFHNARRNNETIKLDNFIEFKTTKVTWNRGLKNDLARNTVISFQDKSAVRALYRPFFKQHLYFAKELNDMVYQIPKIFPDPSLKNILICVSGLGGSKNSTTIITDLIPDLNCLDSGTQCFPLYYYEEPSKNSPTLFDTASNNDYIRRDGISDFILERAKNQYGISASSSTVLSKKDIFYYVYGILHSPDYRTAFANDLKKMLPRIPLVDDVRDFWAFSKGGRKLADLHVNYETVPAFAGVKVNGAESGFYRVEKMRFPKKGQKDSIIYNSKISIENIPARAYEYEVNGKSAIEWIMERYQVSVHKDSGIKNDPNDWAEEVGNPRYILDLLLSVINVSMQTVEIVEGLPGVGVE